MIPLKHLLESCTSPASILTLFVLVAVWLRGRAERSHSLKVCLILSAALHLILLSTPLGEILIGSLEQPYLPLLEPDRHGSIHWIVVLSAYGVDYPGTPVTSNLSEETLCRLVEAVRVYKLVPKARIVVSGGVLRKGERPIAEQMADFILSLGIPRQDILAEVESKDTYENLRNTQELVQNDVLPGHFCVSLAASAWRFEASGYASYSLPSPYSDVAVSPFRTLMVGVDPRHGY